LIFLPIDSDVIRTKKHQKKNQKKKKIDFKICKSGFKIDFKTRFWNLQIDLLKTNRFQVFLPVDSDVIRTRRVFRFSIDKRNAIFYTTSQKIIRIYENFQFHWKSTKYFFGSSKILFWYPFSILNLPWKFGFPGSWKMTFQQKIQNWKKTQKQNFEAPKK